MTKKTTKKKKPAARKPATKKPAKYKPIPIAAARDISTRYLKDQVIVVAWDAAHGKEHVTTYGATKEQCRQAALGGDKVKKALGWSAPEEPAAPVVPLGTRIKQLEIALEEACVFADELIDVMEGLDHEDEIAEYRNIVEYWQGLLPERVTPVLSEEALQVWRDALAATPEDQRLRLPDPYETPPNDHALDGSAGDPQLDAEADTRAWLALPRPDCTWSCGSKCDGPNDLVCGVNADTGACSGTKPAEPLPESS